MSDTNYESVIEANIHLHSNMADQYNEREPHFRPENLAKVKARLLEVRDQTSGERMLDLGCGTGFMINLGRDLFQSITGVDVTRAMMDRVDKSGPAEIELIEHDTGSVEVASGSYDVVTAYSFLHHLFEVKPTLETAYSALKDGGKFYADLDPNGYFWSSIEELDPDGTYDPVVQREIANSLEMDKQVAGEFDVSEDTFNEAEYGKNIAGGFYEEKLTAALGDAGFENVEFFYHWYVGQAWTINESEYPGQDRIALGDMVNDVLQKAFPLTRHLFKYVGFVATK